jgi:hypothetical protein
VKRSTILRGACVAAAATLLFFANASNGVPASNGVTFPKDAAQSCMPANYYTLKFKLNAVAKPADGLKFVPYTATPDCGFFQWASQMFVWVTSPAPSLNGGGGGRIFDSPAFYDVSPPDSSGNRTLIPHVAGKIKLLEVRGSKAGAHGLPIIFGLSGQPLEVQPKGRGPHGKPLILNSLGKPVPIGRVTLGPGGQPVFLDPAGKTIAHARPLFATAAGDKLLVRPVAVRPAISTAIPVERYVIGGKPVYIDGSGNAVPIEQGQADGAVLEAKNGSLIYYATMVNDVYAYFLTGRKNGAFAATHFPTTQADLDDVVKFAKSHGKTFSNPTALAIELKTSWVEAKGLADPSSYITTTGTIPTYDRSNPQKWKPNGHKTVELALVGMHVVGSVRGQPSMIWSTFEHVDNTPEATYQYYSYAGTTLNVKTFRQNYSSIGGSWLFYDYKPGSAAKFNQAHMLESGKDIVWNPPFQIGPSNTIRWKAWGVASDVATRTLANSNTEIISIDSGLRTLLDKRDVRTHYIMVGATWTIGGGPPAGLSNEGGSTNLSNTTMETYQQGIDTTSRGAFTCFECHSAASNDLTAMSHVYPYLQPLFKR